jgi:tRNA(adenine34) deaminase
LVIAFLKTLLYFDGVEIQPDDIQFMRRALQQAKEAFDKDEVPVGAIVVMHNKIIGRGHNLTETLKDPTAHAEMMALTAAFSHLGAKYLPDATLYVTVEPCTMCAGALYWSKVGRIVYGAEDVKNGYKKFCGQHEGANNGPFHPKTLLVKGVLAEECALLMKTFFQAKRMF